MPFVGIGTKHSSGGARSRVPVSISGPAVALTIPAGVALSRVPAAMTLTEGVAMRMLVLGSDGVVGVVDVEPN